MKLAGFGIFENVFSQIDKTHAALRTSLRPPEKGVFGSYSMVLTTGAFVAGALTAQPVMAFRWTSAAGVCLLRKVTAAVQVTTAFAQGAVAVDLIRGKAVAAQYTGGANVTLAGSDQVKSSRLAASQQGPIAASAVGNIAVANTAALSAPGTAWTFDSSPFARADSTLTTGMPTTTLFEARPFDEPAEFRQSEGFLARVTWPATGVVNPVVLVIDWDEVDPARYFGNF